MYSFPPLPANSSSVAKRKFINKISTIAFSEEVNLFQLIKLNN